MTVALRPGAAVYAVGEGLLFSGWSSGGLMACSPGVVKLWRSVEPVLRAGTDPDALRGRMPEKAGAILDQILATLTAHDMLMPQVSSAVPPYLAAIAPDPVAAARRAASVRLRLVGDAACASGIGPALARAGFPVSTETDRPAPTGGPSDSSGVGTAPTRIGSRFGDGEARSAVDRDRIPVTTGAGDGRDGGDGKRPVWTVYVGAPTTESGAEIAVIVSGDAIRVGTGADVTDATAAGAYTIGKSDWAMARAVVVDRVLRLCAGLTSPAVVIRGRAAQRIAEAEEPEPGDLPQLPLAQQRIGLTVGAGVDQTAAADDARRNAMRTWVGGLDAPGWSVGPIGAAGADPLDLWIDAVGRLLVAEADRPTEPTPPDLPRSVRWRRSITRHDGREPTVHCGVTRLGVAVAVAATAHRESWGYGADRASAVEHALRGLLVSTPPPGRIAISHEAGAAQELEPLLGDRDKVAEAVPGLRFELCAEEGVLAGRIGIA